MLYPLLALIWNLLVAPLVLVRALVRRVSKPEPYVALRLQGSPAYRSLPWARWSGQRSEPSLEALEQALRAAAADPRVEGLVVRIGPLSTGWARTVAVARTVRAFGESGKRTLAVLVEPGHRELLVAAACDEVWLHEASPMMIAGLSVEVAFFGGAAERLGLVPQMERVGAYKAAVEPLTRRGPSPEFAEAMDGLLTSLRDDLADAMARRPGWDLARALAALDGGPYSPAQALDAGIVDALCAPSDVGSRLSDGDEPVEMGRLDRHAPGRTFVPLHRPPAIDLIPVPGTIRTVAGAPWSSGADAESIVRRIERSAKSSAVRAIVVHVDSRGGSATASDLLWGAIVKAREKKPVVAWMGEYAASGGYYVACAADVIVAAPGTLTGSIGVIAGKVVVRGLLDRLGVHREVFSVGLRGGMFSPARPFEDDELEWLRGELRATYDRFVECVVKGRGLSADAVERYAQGRVWTGRQAKERGLVDQLGAWPEALALARERAGLSPNARVRVTGPRRRNSLPAALSSPSLATQLLDRLEPGLVEEVAWLASPESSPVVAWCPLRLS